MKSTQPDPRSERRQLLRTAAGAGGLALVGCATSEAPRAGHVEPSELFGENGFQNDVAEIARLEAALGIGDLARSTAP